MFQVGHLDKKDKEEICGAAGEIVQSQFFDIFNKQCWLVILVIPV